MFFYNEPVLVTGSEGLIGGAVVAQLVAEGAKVRRTVHRKRSPAPVETLQCDLTNRSDCLKAVEGMKYVFHCAARTGGAAATVSSPMAPVTHNMVMDSQMLEAAYSLGVEKFMWLGSSTSYPMMGAELAREDQILEGELHPTHFHIGWMKRFSELLCQMYGEKIENPMTTVVLRPTNVYGPGDKFDPGRSHVTAAFIRKVVERQDPIEVWGSGEDVRDLIYIHDFIDGMMMAMEQVESYDTFNIASGQGIRVLDILKIICELEDFHPEIVTNPDMPSTIPIKLVDTTKAKEVLGFEAKTSLSEGITETIKWYKESLK
jgi:GDP-L-fucose synthase